MPPEIVAHLRKYPAGTLDHPSLRNVHDMLTAWLADHNRITATVPADQKEGWDEVFAEDVGAVTAALAEVEAALAALPAAQPATEKETTA